MRFLFAPSFLSRIHLKSFQNMSQQMTLTGLVLVSLISSVTFAESELSPSGRTLLKTPSSNSISSSEIQSSNRSPWSVSFFEFASASAKVFAYENPRLETYNYLSFNYAFNSEYRLSLRPIFLMSSAGQNKYGDFKKAEFNTSDVYFNLADRDLGFFADTGKISASYKVYLPTSKYSQDNTLLTRVGAEFIFVNKIASQWQFVYHVKPDFYFYKTPVFARTITMLNSSQLGGNPYVKNTIIQSKQAALDHYVDFTRNLNRLFNVTGMVGLEHEFYYGSDRYKKNAYAIENFKWGSSLELKAHKNVSFILGFENTLDILHPKKAQQLLKTEELDYYLITMARI
jgi:hypothetical protein